MDGTHFSLRLYSLTSVLGPLTITTCSGFKYVVVATGEWAYAYFGWTKYGKVVNFHPHVQLIQATMVEVTPNGIIILYTVLIWSNKSEILSHVAGLPLIDGSSTLSGHSGIVVPGGQTK